MSDFFTKLKEQSKNPILAQESFKESFTKNNYQDDTYWKPTKTAAGTASAKIRFLQVLDVDALKQEQLIKKKSIVNYFNHFYKTPSGAYYIENSLTTFGENDHMGEYCRELWKMHEKGDTEAEKIFRQCKRRCNYVANILVISDPENPKRDEVEGKVFKYRFGQKIFEKIKEKITPEFETDPIIDVFDLFTGCDFNLKIKKKDGYDNYDSSSFSDAQTAVVNSAEELIALQSQIHDIEVLVDREKSYKTAEDLKASFIRAFGRDELAYLRGESNTAPAPTSYASAPPAEAEAAPVGEVAASSADGDLRALFS